MSSRNVVDLRNRGVRTAWQKMSRLPLPERKPRTPLRARRRRARLALVLAALVLVGGLVYGISYVSYLPRFNVGTISVAGTQNVPARLVQAYAETQLYDGTFSFLSHDNIFLYNPARLAREIVGYFPRIKSVAVARDSMLATAVTIAVTERQPFALWCAPAAGAGDSTANCYQMDDSGFIFAQAPSVSPTQYVFQGGIATSSSPIGHSFAPAHLPGLLTLLRLLGQAGFTAQGATVESEQDFSVPLSSGFYIKASFGEDANALVRNLQLILSSDALQGKEDQLEYVDLRFGDRVYYKLKGRGQATASQQTR